VKSEVDKSIGEVRVPGPYKTDVPVRVTQNCRFASLSFVSCCWQLLYPSVDFVAPYKQKISENKWNGA